MFRLLGLPGLGFVLRPLVIALLAGAFLTGIRFERAAQQDRCLDAGGSWSPEGFCAAPPR